MIQKMEMNLMKLVKSGTDWLMAGMGPGTN